MGRLTGSLRLESASTDRETTRRFRKPVVGLAGGVGAGKSSVAQIMSDLGGGVISSDELSHEEINASDVKNTLVRWWGPSILAADGSVDRKQIAALVFSDPAQRHRLESLIHPRVAVRRLDRMAELDAQPRTKFLVIDSPLLYESDLDLECDAVVFVDADDEVRRQRSEKLRGWPEGEMVRREKSQQPLDMKRARADYTCKNNSNLADLRKQVEQVISQIIAGFGSI
ncbi:MAG: dephospho-CoA kinase [Phycisphaerae bacterium]|nr:dephospho-CoA kinase [Phycisphaerae bacterium]